MRATLRPKPIGKVPEIRLEHRVEHLDDGTLNDLVLQRSNPKRPQPPVRLGDINTTRRRRPETTPMHPLMQISQVGLQILPVGPPRHPIRPRCSLGADRPIRPPKPIKGDVVHQGGEPHLFVSNSNFTHTAQIT